MADRPHPRHLRLARRLIEIARAQDWPKGHRLTEEAAAALLGVSRTPVRGALRQLVTLGVLGRSGRGQVLLRSARALSDAAPEVPQTVDAQLRAMLIRDRLDGAIPPEPSQAELARRYGVGIPVLHRVLGAMAQEGLVSHEGWHWAFTPTLQTQASRQASYTLRLILEPAALRLPSYAPDPGILQTMLDEHDQMLASLRAGPTGTAAQTAAGLFELDARFHENLAEFAGNPFILVVIRQQNALRKLLEVGSYDDAARVAEWLEEHQQIARSLMHGAVDRAADLLAAHLRAAARAASAEA